MMKKYTAKTLFGAQRRVRDLIRLQASTSALLEKYASENKELQLRIVQLAKLAADGPCFDNPLIIAEAKTYRDGVLRAVGLHPDGRFM